MKAKVMTWKQLSAREHDGARVLFEGQLVTVRTLGTQMSAVTGSMHKLSYLDGAKMMRVAAVKGGHLTAVLESGSEEQEDHGTT